MFRHALALCALTLAVPVAGQAPPAPPPAAAASPALERRADELVALLNGGGDPAALFHPDFLAAVPAAQVRALSAQMVGTVGAAQRVQRIDVAGPGRATVVFACASGTITLGLAIEPVAPNRIVGLRVLGVGVAEASIPAVIDALKGLPGTTGFALADLDTGTPTITAGHNAEVPLPAGSAFKLVILAELVRAIDAGERRWDEIITLDGRELPGGAYTQSPKGTAIPIRTLAEKMISVSDNSATDILLYALGRERVEAMQRTVGVADPARNRPFLGTMEAFKLKGIARLREPWLAGNEKARRRMLPAIAAAPTTELAGLFKDGKPVAPDRIEWFLSPADLVRVLDWLRRNTETGPAAEARRILAINPGIAGAGRYRYVGYKGGSEPGVIAMALLLQRQDGGWYALTGSWLNSSAAVEDARFAGLIGRAAELSAAAP